MILANWLLLFVGIWLVVGPIALVAELNFPGLLRQPRRPAPRPVARPRPVRLVVTW